MAIQETSDSAVNEVGSCLQEVKMYEWLNLGGVPDESDDGKNEKQTIVNECSAPANELSSLSEEGDIKVNECCLLDSIVGVVDGLQIRKVRLTDTACDAAAVGVADPAVAYGIFFHDEHQIDTFELHEDDEIHYAWSLDPDEEYGPDLWGR